MSVLKKIFGDEKKQSFPDSKAKLEQAGVMVINDEKLDGRLVGLARLNFEMQKSMKSGDARQRAFLLKKKLEYVDEIIKEIAMPWCRAANQEKHFKALKGLERLKRLAVSVIDNITQSINEKENYIDQNELVVKLEDFLNVEVFPYYMMVCDASFDAKDVSPSFNVIVPQQQPNFSYGGAQVSPTSAGRTSHEIPDGAGFPKRMSSLVYRKEGGEEGEVETSEESGDY